MKILKGDIEVKMEIRGAIIRQKTSILSLLTTNPLIIQLNLQKKLLKLIISQAK